MDATLKRKIMVEYFILQNHESVRRYQKYVYLVQVSVAGLYLSTESHGFPPSDPPTAYT